MENPPAVVGTPGATARVAEPSSGASAKLELMPSRQFPAWLAEQRLSLAFTTYQAGKLFLIGLQPNGRPVGVRAHLQPLHGAVRATAQTGSG